MALVIQITDPSGGKYFASKADSEGLRASAPNIEQAERFSSREAADNAVFALRQIRELKAHSFDIIKLVAFQDIESEFKETFGYIRQDIAKILEKDLRLHYTIALLVCCACEMLTWHRDLREDQVFTLLLPDTEPYKTLGKTLWEAFRNGLAHNFRPCTIKIDDDEWRFAISSDQSRPHMTVHKGEPDKKRPHWIHVNIRVFSARVISQIDAYEQELRTSSEACRRFDEKSKMYLKGLNPDAIRIGDALRLILGTTNP
jgi:hypothetical protein